MQQTSLNTHFFNPIDQEPISYTVDEKQAILDKINELNKSQKNRVVFFEYLDTTKQYRVDYFQHREMIFTKEQIQDATIRNAIEKLFFEAHGKLRSLLVPGHFTIIDGVYNRVRTTVKEVHDNRKFCPKVPHSTTYYVQDRFDDVVKLFLRDTFDNLTGANINRG